MSDPILEIRRLRLTIRTDEGMAKVLDHIDFALERGRILGIVGESGCGKSTIIRAIIGILPPGAKIEAGVVRFDGEDLLGLSEGELNRRSAVVGSSAMTSAGDEARRRARPLVEHRPHT